MRLRLVVLIALPQDLPPTFPLVRVIGFPIVPLGAVTHIPSFLPLGVLFVSARVFSVNDQPNIFKKEVSHPNPQFRLIPRIGLPTPSAPILKSGNLYSLGNRKATLGDLEQIRTQYNILLSVPLRVSRVDERPECLLSDGIALYIDVFDLGLRLSL